MTNEEFQRWLAEVERLTAAQRERLQQVVQELGDEVASLAAIELRVDERRRCPPAEPARPVAGAGAGAGGYGPRGRNGGRGSHPIQTVNQRHRQLKQFLLPFHGVATKCLDNYLRWHQEIGLASQPSPPGAAQIANSWSFGRTLWLLIGLGAEPWPMLAQAAAVAADADDVAVVQEAVDEGCGHDLVAERGAPFLAALVGSERRGRSFVPRVDELKEEHGAVLADGEVADLVDHQRRGSPG